MDALNKPFKGMAFCCTSIPSTLREEISQKLTSMGGTHYSDLMSDVNYLVVGDRKTDKYNYCVKHRHDVKFLRPESIQTVYELWLKGEESHDLLDINNYLLPVFSGLVVCMSRVEFKNKPLHERIFQESFRRDGTIQATSLSHLEIYESQALAKYIEANGGRVTDSLTISNSCVITTERKGKRFLKAIEWNIPVVHPIWVYDSLLRMAALKLEDYTLEDQQPYNQGCMVWDQVRQGPKAMKRSTIPVGADVAHKAKLNSSVAPKSERPLLSRTPSVWNSIMTTNHAPSKKRSHDENLWEENEDDENDDDNEELGQYNNNNENPNTILKSKLIFLGLNFLIIGFSLSQKNVLEKVIESNGGETTELNDTSITHIVIPAASGCESSAVLKMLPTPIKQRINSTEIEVVTEWFVERSVYYEKCVLDNWGKPLRGLLSLTKSLTLPLRKLKICITGFTGIELLHIQKLINYMGFQFCESLTSDRDLVIVNVNLFRETISKKSPKLLEYTYQDVIDCPVYLTGVSFVSSRNKINAAKNWEIPILSIAYLWETLILSAPTKLLIMPDILDLKWCIFVPRGYNKTTTLIDYMRSMEAINQEEQPLRTPTKESGSLPRLPSPRKGSTQKFGRLAGRSPQKIIPPIQPHQDQDITLEEDEFTVGYASEQVELPKKKRRTRK